jgi:hypothetical protein
MASGEEPNGYIIGETTTVRDRELDLALGADEALVLEEGLDAPPHATLVTVDIHAIEGCSEFVVGDHVLVLDLPAQE